MIWPRTCEHDGCVASVPSIQSQRRVGQIPFLISVNTEANSLVRNLNVAIARGDIHLIQSEIVEARPAVLFPVCSSLIREAGAPQGQEVRAPSSEAPDSTPTFPSSPKIEQESSRCRYLI